MESITLKNFRCFREEQTARLAPLTLLVGENSTGKTSFLAMIRAMLDFASGFRIPDFKEEPYDLGSFDEIAHYRGGRGGRADTFEAALSRFGKGGTSKDEPYQFQVTFGKNGTTPVPIKRRLAHRDTWFEEYSVPGEPYRIQFKTKRGTWEWNAVDQQRTQLEFFEDMVPLFPYSLRILGREDANITPLNGSPAFILEDRNVLSDLDSGFSFYVQRAFASAPVRSKPRRTYDPARTTRDPEGDYLPMYLASVFFKHKAIWEVLKSDLERFGQISGLFDEVSIKPFGRKDSEPFQLLVRKSGGQSKGPWRNLIDVGYGVSQVLPVLTELLRLDAPDVFLLQQPEVHLHPSAQAALGSLFCQVAGPNRQLVVETHSDHLLDRVRMDIRDGNHSLKPDDVSILFFERGDLDVRIHSLSIDEEGNIVDAPDAYRSFFMEETARSLGL